MVHSGSANGLEQSIRYDVSKFTDTRDRKLEDVMKKMPGLSVSSWGSSVSYSYNGMFVGKVYVNGLDILGDDNSAVNNMKPEEVAYVEIMENHVTEKVMKGIQYSDMAAINVILKESGDGGWSGTLKAGAGIDPGLYNVDINALKLGSSMVNNLSLKADNTGLDLGDAGGWGGGGNLLPQFLNVSPSMAPLADRRVRFNNSLQGALGTTFLMGGDYSLNLQLSYAGDRIRASSFDETTYFLDQGESVIDQVGESALSDQRTLYAAAILLSNTDKRFLQNRLSFSSDTRTVDKAISGSFPSEQTIETVPVEFVDEFQYKFPLGKNILSIEFEGSFRTRPQHLDITNDENTFSQTIFSKSLSGNLSASYNIMLGKFNAGLKAGVSEDYREIRTDMDGDTGMDAMKNESSLHRFRLYSDAVLTYIGERLQASLSLPLKRAGYRMADLVQDTLSTGARFHFSPSLEMKYQATENLSFNAEIASRQSEVNTRRMYPGLIFKDFRTASRGSSVIDADEEKSIDAGFAFRHPKSSLFISGSVARSWENPAFIGIMEFSENYIINGYSLAPEDYMDRSTRMSAEVSKGIAFLRGKVGLGGFGMISTSSVIRNDAVIPLHSRSLGFQPSVNGRVFTWCNVNYGMDINWRWMNMSDEDGSSNSTDYTQSLEMIFSPWEKFNFSFLAEHYHTEFYDGMARNLVLADFKAEYTVNPKWVIMLSVTNLLDQDTYNYTLVDSNSFTQSYSSYAIRPRNFLLSFYHKI